MALRLGRVGQEGMGVPRRSRREHRLDGRRGHEPDVGRALRPRARHGRALDQDVRPVAHRLVQRSRHDGAGVDRAADGRRPQAGTRRRVRLDRRYVGVARRVCRRGGDSVDRHSAARQGFDGAARAAARQRRARAVARHRFRRLHGDRAAAVGRRGRLPRELDEQPAPRGTEDRRRRDRAAVRLVGARRHHHPRRKSRKRQRAWRGLRHDGVARAHHEASAHRRRAGRRRESALPRVQEQLGISSDHGEAARWRRRFRSAIPSR